MILFTACTLKVLLLLAALFVGWRQFHLHLTRRSMISLDILVVLFAAAANFVSGYVPPVRDQVTLTAQGTGSAAAVSTEVYLAGYTVDGDSYTCGESLLIKEGHWFWSGETYAWRPETDSRQPDGVTRTVVLEIPVGWIRTLDFEGNQWRGMVEISGGTGTRTIDTYSESSSAVSAELGRSKTSDLILNQVRYLMVYAALMLVWFAGMVFIVRAALRSAERTQAWLKKNLGKLIYLGISLTTFGFMVLYADRISFWADELSQIAFVKGSLTEAFLCCLKLYECSPPLALMCSAVWYRIAPYGERWLLLISILLSALSIYMMGLIGEKLRNTHCGVLAAAMFAFSTTVWTNVAYEFRAYPYLMVFSVLTLYFYIRKNEPERERRWLVAFSLSMTSLAMSHYFGMLACAAYFLGDLFLWSKKQVKWTEGILYLLPGGCSIAWLAAVACYQGKSFISGLQWYGIPTMAKIQSLLVFLAGQTEFSYWILLLGITGAIAYCLRDKRGGQSNFVWPIYYRGFLAVVVITVIAAMFVYGAYINPKSTLWTERYFLFLVPNTTVLSAIVWCDLAMWLGGKDAKSITQKTAVLFLSVLLSLNCLVTMSTAKSHEGYRESADWLYRQSNYIFNDSTLIITVNDSYITSAWNEYYIARQGRRDSLNTVSQYSLNYEEALQYKRIYVNYWHTKASPSLQTFLAENYTMIEDHYSDLRLQTFTRKK